MTSRRQFIKASAGALVLARPAANLLLDSYRDFPDPGVQLFTFFNTMDNDVEGTLRQASTLGIKNVESAFSRKGDYYGMKPGAFASLLKSLGMRWRSHHVLGAPLKNVKAKNLKENLTEILDDARAGGLEYIVAAHLPIATSDDIKTSLDILNNSAGVCESAGVQLVYHNEPADFTEVDGRTPYDSFLSQTGPKALKFELDIAWAVKGGQDPESLFKAYPGRFPLWHIKDLSKDYQTVLPVGEGVLDYKKYFSSAHQAGLRYYFIEHENPQDAIASIRESIQSIKAIAN